MALKIAVLAGDGIGPEVIGVGLDVLKAVAKLDKFDYTTNDLPYGGAHYLKTGQVVTDEQVESGIRQAVQRVIAPGVFIEGNSILEFIQADFVLMVSRASGGIIKGSARKALSHSSAIYLSNITEEGIDERTKFALWRKQSGMDKLIGRLPIYTKADLPDLIAQVQKIGASSNIGAERDRRVSSPSPRLVIPSKTFVSGQS